MFQNLKDESKYLYHYTTVDKAVDFILKDKTLMFNSLRNTNDPKESKNWKFDFHIGDGASPSHAESMKLWETISEEIKLKCKILCFSKDKSCLGDDFFNDIYLRGFAKSRMWAQYGDDHKGVCLIFSKKKIEALLTAQFGSISDLYATDIKYKNRPLKGDICKSPYTLHYSLLKELGVPEYVKRHIYTHNNELIFEKSLDWRDEEEYRYMMLINNINNQYLKYENALCGVVFGAGTDDKDQKRIFQMTYKDGTEFEQIKYSNSTPWLSFKDFRIYHT
ncbi:DUF2971 domain-containing protein [Psychromonas algicola]|uniref:DUF2971 domain-containing protein n=1 Tax=Psychromonas algicola TaxID=2555642 RepID=UPI0010688EB8|nr:DUF2971 domain-containing protein [Psychromonas sp. RZ5]TEW43610.1 DUF2971 domain-containing protein [Psychromonas sp. RZ5]